jgi:TonB family protein
MSFFSNTQETAGRYGKYIPEFQELFRRYEVSFGTSKDFLRLPSKLAYDGDFRVEFSALAKSVGEREEGRLSLMQMLTIIAIATGGPEIEEVGSAGAVPISLLVVFLSEIGGWHEEPTSAGVAQGEEGGDESEAAELEQRLAEGHKEGLEGVAASLFTGPDPMKEALSRLELNALQLKLHLDSIDTRMERIEPHLDDLTWRFAAHGETATEEGTRMTGTSDEPRARFSSEMRSERRPERRPGPTKREEGPESSSWEVPAPPMRPFPVDRERDLAWETTTSAEATGPEMAAPGSLAGSDAAIVSGSEAAREPLVETSAPGPIADWRSAVARLLERELQESQLRAEMPESVREPVRRSLEPEARVQVPEPFLREPLVKESVPEPLLREPLVKESVQEPLLREPPSRVPFGEYLRDEGDEDEELPKRRWGRWVLAGLLVLAVAGGALVYRNQERQGLNAGWQHGKALAGAAIAKARLAMDEVKELVGPAPSRTPTPSAEPVGSKTGTARAPRSSAPSTRAQRAPVTAAAPPPVSTTPAVTVFPESARKTATPEEGRGRVVVDESDVGGGAASSSGEAITAPVPSAARVFGGAVPPAFVEASRLTALSRTQPEYPSDAAAQKITGDVVVQAIISPTGTVESAQIVSGPPGLLKASLDAMKGWRYQPYRVNGVPVEVRTYVKFRFRFETR